LAKKDAKGTIFNIYLKFVI